MGPGSAIDSTGLRSEVEPGGRGRVENRDLAAGADEEAADLIQRTLGRAEADPLQTCGSPHERLQALEREREVGAALGVGDGMDLVDDHGLDAARASRRRGR